MLSNGQLVPLSFIHTPALDLSVTKISHIIFRYPHVSPSLKTYPKFFQTDDKNNKIYA